MKFSEHIELILELKTRYSDFIISGSVAAGVYGAPRSSEDMDIIVSLPYLKKKSKLAKILEDMGFKQYKSEWVEDSLIRKYKMGAWKIDVFEMIPQILRGIKKRANVAILRGYKFLIISKEDLIERKLRRGSIQDIADIQQMEIAEYQKGRKKR